MTKENPSVSVKWVENLQFVATDKEGHALIIDYPVEAGGTGTGFTSMRLLLLALAACSAVTVTNILRKMREPIEALTVDAQGIQDDQDPGHPFTEMHVKYVIRGKLRKDQVARAIALSEKTYCSVSATLRLKPKLMTSYALEPPPIQASV